MIQPIWKSLQVAAVALVATAVCNSSQAQKKSGDPKMVAIKPITLNEKDDGYRGIWYKIGEGDKEAQFQYKYSGGLGTYCCKHFPFAIYSPRANKTFFCYGGATRDDNHRLVHMVSYYDHATGLVPRPTLLLDKQTNDAHDNPVISIDNEGYIWIFSTSHGRSRPSYLHRSKRPLEIDEFEMIHARRSEEGGDAPFDNFSYAQVAFDPDRGFIMFFTRYNFPAQRTSCLITSRDGVQWSNWRRLAAIGQGHYQVGAVSKGKIATMMDYHPKGKGLDHRTNLYYMESSDQGETWRTVDGRAVSIPLTTAANEALVRDYESEGLLVYVKDLRFDREGRPLLLYLTSRGHQAGPANDPRTLTIARWTGKEWKYLPVATADHNYDMGSLCFEEDGTWRVIASTEPGPQPYATGGEIVSWVSSDQGETWSKERQLTSDSKRNHSYARRVVDAHDDFYAFWADGHSYEPSESALYFSNRAGEVFRLPTKMDGETAKPERVNVNVP